MKKISLTVVGVLLVIGIIINVQQGGAATTATKWGYAPLGAYLLYWGISWAISAWRNRKR